MAKAKKKVASKTSRSTVWESETPEQVRQSFSLDTDENATASPRRFLKFSRKTLFFVLLIVILLVVGYVKKSWFVAAIVNGKPITNAELLYTMNKQNRSQTLNQMINEEIILQEAKRNNVSVSSEDIDKRVTQIESSVGGGEQLDALLMQQGQSRSDLRTQLELQLAVEKLYEKEATISSQEIDQFVEQNKAQFTSSDSAQQRTEAEEAIKQQKLSSIISQKFQELKQKASVNIF